MRTLVFTVALASTFAFARGADAQGCMIVGEPTTLTVDVTPTGGATFALLLDELEVTISPTRNPELANVRVQQGLAFMGTTTYAPYVVRAPVTLHRGVLRITRSTIPFHVRAVGERLVADLLLVHDVTVHDVPLDCRALALGVPPRAEALPARTYRDPPPMPRDATFLLFAQPGDTSGVRVSGNDLVVFDRVVVRDEWARVRWRQGSGGASLSGYLRADAIITRFPQVSMPSIGDPAPPDGQVRVFYADDPNVYVGPATIDAGTEVTRGTHPFATTVADVTYRVRVRAGEARAELLGVPGIHERGCREALCDTFVPASAVHVPARR